MPYYAIAQMQVHDPAWVADYVLGVTPLVESFGGRYLARTPHLEWVEGQERAGHLAVLIEWPSREAAMEFYESDDYRPHREARLAGSTGEFLLVPGRDTVRS